MALNDTNVRPSGSLSRHQFPALTYGVDTTAYTPAPVGDNTGPVASGDPSFGSVPFGAPSGPGVSRTYGKGGGTPALNPSNLSDYVMAYNPTMP